ncbi:hypothetical protein ACQP3D_30460, partial [Escherichia coli]
LKIEKISDHFLLGKYVWGNLLPSLHRRELLWNVPQMEESSKCQQSGVVKYRHTQVFYSCLL